MQLILVGFEHNKSVSGREKRLFVALHVTAWKIFIIDHLASSILDVLIVQNLTCPC